MIFDKRTKHETRKLVNRFFILDIFPFKLDLPDRVAFYVWGPGIAVRAGGLNRWSFIMQYGFFIHILSILIPYCHGDCFFIHSLGSVSLIFIFIKPRKKGPW